MEAHEYDEWTKTSSHQSRERCIINYDERIKNFLNMNIELKPVSHAALVDRLSTGPSGCYGNDLSLKVSVLNWQEGTLQTKFRLQIPTPIEKALLSAFESQNYIRKNIIKNFLPNHWRWFEIFRIIETLVGLMIANWETAHQEWKVLSVSVHYDAQLIIKKLKPDGRIGWIHQCKLGLKPAPLSSE